MAPLLPKRTGLTTSEDVRNPPALLLQGLASVAPVVMMILLLLLCFPFKRKKRQFPIRASKRDPNMSQLLSMNQLEDQMVAEETSLDDGARHKGNSLPYCQPEVPTNGVATVAKFQQGSANSPTEIRPDPLRRMAAQRVHPRPASPRAVQCRKLPLTPKETPVSKVQPLNRDTDNNVYESIHHNERDLGTGACVGGKNGADPSAGGSPNSTGVQDPCAGSVESAGKDRRAVAGGRSPAQPGASMEYVELPLTQLPGRTCEPEAPLRVVFDTEMRLSAMYARVHKKPKPSQHLQPANHEKPAEQEEEEEEEAPPIPEKHFENIYESLVIDTVVQGGAAADPAVSSEA